MVGAIFAQYGLAANDDWAREIAYRQIVLQTYDVHENGLSEDLIGGGVYVNANWFNIVHPWPLRWVSLALGWLPEELGASRENHFVRSSSVVTSIIYGDGEIVYSTFDAPENSVDVFRLSFVPDKITADGEELSRRPELDANGFTVKELPNGDAIVEIRRDGAKNISITGDDPQSSIPASDFNLEGKWEEEGGTFFTAEKGASASATFFGNQVRLVGHVGPDGGKAEVYIDGEKQNVPIDFWNPTSRECRIRRNDGRG